MNRIKIITSLVILASLMIVAASAADSAEDSGMNCDIFNTEEILDESTLDIKTLQDWHTDKPTGSTRQKLIEIKVAEWWPGKEYRIPVRMFVPLEGKAKGFYITGGNPSEYLMMDSRPNDFQARLLANGVGIVKTVVKPLKEIPGKEDLEQEMGQLFLEELNPRYTTVWIWSMTLMRAATAAYAEADHFEKGKVAGSGGSKNGISPATALINDERFTATCSDRAFAYYSPTRRIDREEMDKVEAANKAFFEAVNAGDIDLKQQRAKWYQANMVGSETSIHKLALKAGRSMDELHDLADCLLSRLCVTENWDRLMERGVDMLFQPGSHDYVAFDILWGAQNHPQLPVYYEPSGGHKQIPHGATEKDNQNQYAFLWNHFFGGEPLLKPPKSNYKVDKDKLSVSVSFNEGPQPISGRIWWIYDRAPAGSAPFLHVQIPEDQWMDMECDAKTGAWTTAIPLKDGFSRIDFFSNHGLETNGYKHYLSSPYTQVDRKEQKQTVKKKRQGRAAVPQDVVDQYQSLEFQGMPYRFLPLEKPALDTKYPLILSLHGGAGRGTCNLANLRAWNKTFVNPQWREQYPCYVVAPQTSETWRVTGQEVPELTDELIASFPEVWQENIKKNKDKPIVYNHSRETTGSLSLAVELVKDICERYPIDKDRIYVLGHSMGGFGSWNAAWGFPDFFAAAIPSAGGIAPWKDRSRFVDLPIWAFHGDEDDRLTTDYTREIFKTMQELGGNLKYTELKGVAHAAPQFAPSYKVDDPNTGHSTKFASGKCDKTEDVWQWLFNQKRAR